MVERETRVRARSRGLRNTYAARPAGRYIVAGREPIAIPSWFLLLFFAFVLVLLGFFVLPPLLFRFVGVFQFPPLASLNKINDGSAKNRRLARGNTLSFAKKVRGAIT